MRDERGQNVEDDGVGSVNSQVVRTVMQEAITYSLGGKQSSRVCSLKGESRGNFGRLGYVQVVECV